MRRNHAARTGTARRFANGALAIVLAAGLAPSTAFATEDSNDEPGVIEQMAQQLNERSNALVQANGTSLLASNDAYNYEEGTEPAIACSALPSSYDVRDEGVVRPVKRQNPWGTCWGFAAIAAAETSILSEMGTTYEEFPLDLFHRRRLVA